MKIDINTTAVATNKDPSSRCESLGRSKRGWKKTKSMWGNSVGAKWSVKVKGVRRWKSVAGSFADIQNEARSFPHTTPPLPTTTYRATTRTTRLHTLSSRYIHYESTYLSPQSTVVWYWNIQLTDRSVPSHRFISLPSPIRPPRPHHPGRWSKDSSWQQPRIYTDHTHTHTHTHTHIKLTCTLDPTQPS